MPLVRFVLSRGCVEEAEDRPGHHRHGQCAGQTKMTVSAVLIVGNEVIRRMTARVNVVADAGSLFSLLLIMFAMNIIVIVVM